MQESAAGIRIIKAFALEDVMNARMEEAVHRTEARQNARTRVGAITVPMLDVLAGFAIAGILGGRYDPGPWRGHDLARAT